MQIIRRNDYQTGPKLWLSFLINIIQLSYPNYSKSIGFFFFWEERKNNNNKRRIKKIRFVILCERKMRMPAQSLKMEILGCTSGGGLKKLSHSIPKKAFPLVYKNIFICIIHLHLHNYFFYLTFRGLHFFFNYK